MKTTQNNRRQTTAQEKKSFRKEQLVQKMRSERIQKVVKLSAKVG
jgi:hypothetical protein